MPDLISSHSDLLILSVLQSGPAHGYAIIQAIKSGSGDTFDLPEGTIYPALHRLERDGLLTSAWAMVDGRRRRIYELNAAGREALAQKRQAWQRFSGAVNALIGATA